MLVFSYRKTIIVPKFIIIVFLFIGYNLRLKNHISLIEALTVKRK